MEAKFIAIVDEQYGVKHANGNVYDTVTCEYRAQNGAEAIITFNFVNGTSWVEKVKMIPETQELDLSYFVTPQGCIKGTCNV